MFFVYRKFRLIWVLIFWFYFIILERWRIVEIKFVWIGYFVLFVGFEMIGLLKCVILFFLEVFKIIDEGDVDEVIK